MVYLCVERCARADFKFAARYTTGHVIHANVQRRSWVFWTAEYEASVGTADDLSAISRALTPEADRHGDRCYIN